MDDSKPVRLLIVGGSNSVMRDGYAYQLKPILTQLGRNIDVVNVAIGGNNCVQGLATVKDVDLRGFDFVVIEYFVNDVSFFRSAGMAAWCAIYEGIIRAIRQQSPRTTIVPLILGRPNPQLKLLQARMRKAMQRLAAHYDLRIVDFDAYARAALLNDGPLSALYRDAGHYTPPVVTSVVAHHLAIHILDMIARPAAPTADPLPPPLSGHLLEQARLRSFDHILPASLERVRFRNSRYDLVAVRMPEGASHVLAVSGRVLSINFVSSQDSCDLSMESSDGSTLNFHTLHKEAAAGKFGFLIKTANLVFKRWDSDPVPTSVTLTARSAAPGGPNLRKPEQHLMIRNTSDRPKSVYLTSFLEA